VFADALAPASGRNARRFIFPKSIVGSHRRLCPRLHDRARHPIAPMVIRLRNPHGKPFPSGPAKPSDIIAFSISPADAHHAVYTRFIATLKLPFKSDRP
jgi:hypothetical protein